MTAEQNKRAEQIVAELGRSGARALLVAQMDKAGKISVFATGAVGDVIVLAETVSLQQKLNLLGVVRTQDPTEAELDRLARAEGLAAAKECT